MLDGTFADYVVGSTLCVPRSVIFTMQRYRLLIMSHPFPKASTVQRQHLSCVQYVLLVIFRRKGLRLPISKGMTVYKALKQSKAIIGNWVTISGAGGGLGHLGTATFILHQIY
jgi:hypothetical protein